MLRAAFPKSLSCLLPLISLALLLGGCSNRTTTSGPQVLSTLPKGWDAMTTGRNTWFSRAGEAWNQINIDNDQTPEYLLYFTYDNGQVGAIIYDQQTGAAAANSSTPIPAPNQPASQYVPYQVEPSFWTRSDVPDTVGFVAPPDTTIDQLRIEQVQRFPAGDPGQAGTANPEPVEGAPDTNELIIYGGETVISVLWWRNAFNGYGITQMEASGGLQPEERPGDVLRPLRQVVGQTPIIGLLGRSVLCNKTIFKRADAGEPQDVVPPVHQSAVRYDQSSGGIVFCAGAPSAPYYPEGVVLAYLRPAPAGATTAGTPSPELLWSGLSDATRAAIAEVLDLNGPDAAGSPPLIVLDLRTRASIPVPADFRSSTGRAITTNVCADVVTDDSQGIRRRLLFDLIYVPVQENGGVVTPERFAISGVSNITNVFTDCSRILP